MKNYDINFYRNRFNTALEYYKSHGLVVEESQIRIEETLIDGQGKYNFDLKKEILSPSEQNLKRNDLFIVTGLGIFLKIDLNTKQGFAPLTSYPILEDDGEVPGLEGFSTADIEALYQGNLNFSTGSIVNMTSMPLIHFRHVPAILNADVRPAFDMTDAIYPMVPELRIAGTQDHKVEINFPANPTATYKSTTADTTAKVVFLALGFRVVGGTNEKYRTDPANPFSGAI